MKIVFILSCILLLQGTFAHPGLITHFAGKLANDAAAVLSGDETISDVIGNAIKDAVDIAGQFGQIATNVASTAIHIGADGIKAGIDVITSVGNIFENGFRNTAQRFAKILGGIRGILSATLRNAIEVAKIPINNAQNALKDLNNIARNKLNEGMSKLNSSLDAANQLKNWADEQRSRFEFSSDETKQKANQTINDFIQQREKESQVCARGAIKPVQQFFNSSRKLIESGLPALSSVLDTIEKCMKSVLPTPSVLGQCAIKIRRSASKIVAIPRRAIDLKRKFIGGAFDKIMNLPCIAESKLKIEKGKKEVEKTLDDLLESDSSSDNSGSDNSGSDTSGSDNSTSNDSGSNNSTSNDSGSNNSTSNDSGSDNSTSNDSGSDNSTSNDSGSDNSTSNNSTSDDSGSGNSTSNNATSDDSDSSNSGSNDSTSSDNSQDNSTDCNCSAQSSDD